ncbi:hypothetical protein AYO40_02495 [Planctomycetaceae bacterium SCGC AG-212-D15]|nr:hypothetical protein AYO40_02495 [Planctomycetaceae bacterium SCGC AG-212-D15]
MTDATDSQLLERFAASRDEAAFTTLARRHAGRVRGVCRRVLLDEHDAEDALQATFLVLARKAVALPAEVPVGPWLSAVAFRLALHARSARRRRREYAAGLFLETEAGHLELPAAGGDPPQEVVRAELRRLVRQEVAGLPAECRAPARLCYLEGLTNEQAARRLGWPSGSMSRRLDKARRLLRARLAGRGLLLLAGLAFLVLIGIIARSLTAPHFVQETPMLCAAVDSSGTNARHGREVKALFQRLARGEADDAERREAIAHARAAERTAESLETFVPPERQGEWLRLARETAAAARQLADAEDRLVAQRSAIRLCAACLQCHETFRN